MNCILTQQECAEIYSALGHAHARNLQLKIGFDCVGLAKGVVNLSKVEAHGIYDALMSKQEYIRGGAFDTYPDESKMPGSVTFQLLQQVERILSKIGNFGEDLVADSYMSKRA